MIELHGPTYKYNGERLEKPEIIWINDHCFDEEEQCFQVEKLIEAGPCDPQLHTIIFDHVAHDDSLQKYNSVCFPIFLATECQEFIDQNIETNWSSKTHIFNFSLNKPRVHRILLLQEIERLNLKQYTHSLPWKTNNINDIPVTNYKFGPETTMAQGIKNGNFKNALTYNELLKTTVFEPSCVSLITEPCYYEREAMLTEKTYMAIMGGTIPIWFGGWKNAESMAKLGFDTFDDIVDHSYETLEDPRDRCTQALERNLHLLQDISSAQKLIIKNKKRLQRNVDLLMSNPFLEKCFQIVHASQNDLKLALSNIMPNFRHKKFAKIYAEWKTQAQNIDYVRLGN
tara:strand:+ start:638 stop:1663 length:1026 start_codon:yes stop_codon:yes gene_type:complete